MIRRFMLPLIALAFAGFGYAQPKADPQLPKVEVKKAAPHFFIDPKPLKLHHYAHRRPATRAQGTTWTPPALAKQYNFPAPLATGAAQGIALIELGGGFNQADVTAYFQGLQLPVPKVTFVGIQGATNSPDGANGAQGEVMLDICVAGGVTLGQVPLFVVTAPNTTAGFAAAITWAAQSQAVTVVSISWGGPEDSWGASDISSMESAIGACVAAGKPIYAAAGDSGSSDGESGNHVDYPASSPQIIGCGGTSLAANGVETVWNDGSQGGATGGGISNQFPQPTWQQGIGAPSSIRRCVPDVSGNADPDTGYPVLIDGKSEVFGGTSAVAPLWAGLTALLNQNGGNVPGSPGAAYYAAAGTFKDIVSGNNGTYVAKTGYDCCTGLGSPNGAALLAALKGTPPPPPPPPPNGTVIFSFTLKKDAPAGTRLKLPQALPAGTYQVVQP